MDKYTKQKLTGFEKGGIKKRRRRRKLGAKKEPFCPYRVIWAVT